MSVCSGVGVGYQMTVHAANDFENPVRMKAPLYFLKKWVLF